MIRISSWAECSPHSKRTRRRSLRSRVRGARGTPSSSCSPTRRPTSFRPPTTGRNLSCCGLALNNYDLFSNSRWQNKSLRHRIFFQGSEIYKKYIEHILLILELIAASGVAAASSGLKLIFLSSLVPSSSFIWKVAERRQHERSA